MTEDKFRKIGEVLEAARKEQNKTAKEAAEAIKIHEKYIRALEAGNPSDLPSQPYFMLFARSYAQYLGIDFKIFEEMAGSGEEIMSGGEQKKGEPGIEDYGVQGKKFGRRILWLVLIAIILFAALLAYDTWFVTPPESYIEHLGETTATDTVSESESAFEMPADINYEPYQPPDPLHLEMVALQNVWAIVLRDGDTVLNRQLPGGERREWDARYRFELTLGISTAVELVLNGVNLGRLTEQARTITGLEINQVNYEQFYPENRRDGRIMPIQRIIPEAPEPAATQTATPQNETTAPPDNNEPEAQGAGNETD